jgi:hypothetical protein
LRSATLSLDGSKDILNDRVMVSIVAPGVTGA